MNILLKYPTRSRPDWFKETFYQYKNKLSGKHGVHWLITIDLDDSSMCNPNMDEWLDNQLNVQYNYGHSKTKIEACNADMDYLEELNLPWDIVILVSDDMIPVVHGFDDIIATEMTKHFPDMDGALNFPDGCCGDGGLITQTIMGRRLYEQFGYIYHPAYRSFYCDTEFSDVVREMDKCAECEQLIVRHEWKGTNADSLAIKNQKDWNADAATYKRRKAEGWPK